jgi:hypothetical protein
MQIILFFCAHVIWRVEMIILIFVYNLKGKINLIENISKPT